MRKKLFLILVLFFLLGTTTKPVRYVSPWTLIMGGETVQFTHALGTRPLIVQTWAAYPLAGGSCRADFTEVYAAPALQVSRVNASVLGVENAEDAPLCIQVVAQP